MLDELEPPEDDDPDLTLEPGGYLGCGNLDGDFGLGYRPPGMDDLSPLDDDEYNCSEVVLSTLVLNLLSL